MSKLSGLSSCPVILFVIRALIKNRGKILLVQRSHNDSYNPSKWELPGGKLDVGQDVEDALKREILEETGLKIFKMEQLVYWHSHIVSSFSKYNGLPYIVLVSPIHKFSGNVVLSNEHDAFVWVYMNGALKYDLVLESKLAIDVFNNKSS